MGGSEEVDPTVGDAVFSLGPPVGGNGALVVSLGLGGESGRKQQE